MQCMVVMHCITMGGRVVAARGHSRFVVTLREATNGGDMPQTVELVPSTGREAVAARCHSRTEVAMMVVASR